MYNEEQLKKIESESGMKLCKGYRDCNNNKISSQYR